MALSPTMCVKTVMKNIITNVSCGFDPSTKPSWDHSNAICIWISTPMRPEEGMLAILCGTTMLPQMNRSIKNPINYTGALCQRCFLCFVSIHQRTGDRHLRTCSIIHCQQCKAIKHQANKSWTVLDKMCCLFNKCRELMCNYAYPMTVSNSSLLRFQKA